MSEMGVDEFDRVIIHDGAGNYLKVPRLTTTQRDALTAAEGLIIFNSTTNQAEICIDTTWRSINYTALAAHEADLDAHTKNPLEVVTIGEYFSGGCQVSSTARDALANYMYAMPFIVPRNITIDRIAIQVTTAAAAKSARLGIYNDGTNLYPGTLKDDIGLVSVNATGVIAASKDVVLTKGFYWTVALFEANTSIRGSASILTQLGWVATDFLYYNRGWVVAQTYGALPDPFTAGGVISSGASGVGFILCRVKSLD